MPRINVSPDATRRRGLLLLCCLVFVLGFATVPSGTAYAGTWTLVSCSQPGGQPAPTDGWTTSSTGAVGPDSGDVNTCAQGGTLTAVSSAEAPQTAYAGPDWVFTAPAGSTIAGGTLTGTLTSPHGQAWLGTPSPTYDSADLLANCQYNLACGQSGALSGVFPITHTGGTNLYAIAVCVAASEGATICPASSGVDAEVSLSAADIELANSSNPAGSGFAGALLGSPARGTQELAFTATDPAGPGVYAVSAQIDGKTLYTGTPDTNGGECVPVGSSTGALMFDHSQPCRQSESVDLPINTAMVADGQHTLKVTVQDAAQNSSVVYDSAIIVDNAVPSSLGSLGALPGPGTSGANGMGGAAPGPSTIGLGTPNGSTASETALLRLGERETISRSFTHRAFGLTGRLLNGQGQPIGAATLNILQQIAGSSSTQVITHAKTRSNGSFAVRVPAGPSRLIDVAYRAFAADANYAAQAKVEESVGAGVQLSVTPRSTSATGTIVLTGKVQGPIPQQGTIVELLVHYRGHWEPFRTPRTDSSGHFQVAYQFEGGLGHFPFRAEVPAGQANFPFTGGYSKAVDVATR
jgi:hypothetical protein